MERLRSLQLFGEVVRLKAVARAFIPGTGPLATDGGPRAMPVEPEGFNITNELITGMTYFKAPEFVRMTQLLMGDELFWKGLHLYHESYKNANATSIQWIESMEETVKSSGGTLSLKKMAFGWLKRSGHPHVEVKVKYDPEEKSLSVSISQSGFESITQTLDQEEKGGPWDFGADFKDPWIFPVSWGVVTDGKYVKEGLYTVTKAQESFTVKGFDRKPDFLSFARGFSYFGTYTVTTASNSDLALQAMSDPDLSNRFLAYRSLADQEKARLVELLTKQQAGQETKLTTDLVSKDYISAHTGILFDPNLAGQSKALICMETESIDSRPALAHQYWTISKAKNIMYQAVFESNQKKIVDLFDSIESKNKPGPHKLQIHDRALKGQCLRLMVAKAKEDSSVKEMAISRSKSLISSAFMTDRIRGLSNYLLLEDPTTRDNEIERFKKEWGVHMGATEELIGVLSSIDSKDAPALIRSLLKDSIFDINLAGHARTVVRNWAHNRKRCVLTDDGLKLTEDLLVTIGKVNQMSAYALLDSFGDIKKFNNDQKQKMVDCLKAARGRLDAKKETSLYNQIGRLLTSCQ
jgi:aminopeptidase N